MILAAIIPYTHGYAGVVILDTEGPRLLAVRSLEVGRLEELAEPTTDARGRTQAIRRIIDEGDIAGLLPQLFALLESHGAERVVLETPRAEAGGVNAERARAIVGAIMRAAAGAGLGDFVTVVDARWREDEGGREGIAERAMGLAGWPQTAATVDTEGTRASAVLALVHAGTEAQEAPRRTNDDEAREDVRRADRAADDQDHRDRKGASNPDGGSVRHLGTEGSGPALHDEPSGEGGPAGDVRGERLADAGVRGADGDTKAGSCRARVALHIPPADLPPGRRAIHVDPGARWIGLLVTAGEDRLTAAHVETRELGHVETLPRPKTKTRRDGSTRIVTERRVVEWTDVVAIADAIVALAREYGCTHATVEHVRDAYVSGDGAKAGGQIAGVKTTAEAGAAIAYALGAAGLTVARPTVGAVRARVIGKTNEKGDARKGLLGVAVASRIAGWPADTDAHMRDAGALALWSATPAPAKPEPRPERKRTPTRTGRDESHRKRYQEPGRVAARAAEAERRAAAGCTCKRKHKRGCALFVGKFEKTTAP